MSSSGQDRVRQVAVAAGAALAIVGAAWGSGAFGGTPIEDAAGGALAPDATLLAAAEPAFRIWSVIYAGLAAFAVVQALPSRAARPRYRATAWWILASMILNAGWIGVVQAGWLWVSALVLVAIVAVLLVATVALSRADADGWLDRAVTEGTVGVYLGWASVATAANVAAVAGSFAEPWAVVGLAAVLAFVLWVSWRLATRPLGAAMALATAWGLAWIGVARLDAPESDTVAVTALVASAIAAVAAALRLARPSASGGAGA